MPIRIDGSGYIGSANNIYTDGSGRVGIGTASPSHKLHVAGTYANGPSMDPGLGIENTAASRVFKIRVGDGGLFAINDTTAGADRVIVDTSGRVTMPSQPRFRAYINTAVDTTYTINTILPFNAVSFNVGSNYNTSTYLFTAPVAGYYYFHSATYGTASGGTATMALRWYINGSVASVPSTSDINLGTAAAGQVSIAPIQHSVIFSLAAGDTVGSYCTAYNGASIFRIYTGASIFEGYLLG